jgi:hypothetical protein
MVSYHYCLCEKTALALCTIIDVQVVGEIVETEKNLSVEWIRSRSGNRVQGHGTRVRQV